MNSKSSATDTSRLEFRPRGTSRQYDPYHDLVWRSASGPWVWDEHGNRYLDTVCGYSALNLGHCHPRLVQCLIEQSSRLHFSHNAESLERQQLEKSLASVVDESAAKCGFAPIHRGADGPTKSGRCVWISTTGARAIEIAWKIAYSNRPGVLVRFDRGYHGRSLATAQITDTAKSDCFTTFARHHVIPFPCRVGSDNEETPLEVMLEPLRRLLESKATEISAILIEPVIGSRGYYFAPPGFHRRLAELAKSYGVLVISDEIQMGLGRLGGMIASHAQGWAPDLIVVGKSLGGGLLPVSAVVGEQKLMDQLPSGIESETYAAQPLACRIGLEVLAILQQTDCIDSSRKWHERLRHHLRNSPLRDGVDGEGSATVVDFRPFVHHQSRKGASVSNATDVAYRRVMHLRSKGILVHLTGPQRDRIAIIPPLTVDDSHLEYLLKGFASMEAV